MEKVVPHSILVVSKKGILAASNRLIIFLKEAQTRTEMIEREEVRRVHKVQDTPKGDASREQELDRGNAFSKQLLIPLAFFFL